MTTISSANSITDGLFKEHSYYFDSSLIGKQQVQRLIQRIMDHHTEGGRVSDPTSGKGNNPLANPFAKDKPKHNKIMQDIEKARHLGVVEDSVPKGKNVLEPIKNNPKDKLKPIADQVDPVDDFDFLGLEDVGDKKKDKSKDETDKIEDNYDFDFDFEDVSKGVDGSKKSAAPAKKPETKKEDKKDANKAKEKELVNPATKKQEPKLEAKKDDKKEVKKDDEKTDDEEYIIIDGKRFREIQIEGEEEEFLMDDDGNIYDKEGQYIGTAKDGEGEDTEEEK
jgi:hypothetical protein